MKRATQPDLVPAALALPNDMVRVRGAREHNLRDVDVDLPRDALVVFTGISGSGKSSLAFGTLYAEAQRRYFESVSPYAQRREAQRINWRVNCCGGTAAHAVRSGRADHGLHPADMDRLMAQIQHPAWSSLDGSAGKTGVCCHGTSCGQAGHRVSCSYASGMTSSCRGTSAWPRWKLAMVTRSCWDHCSTPC